MQSHTRLRPELITLLIVLNSLCNTALAEIDGQKPRTWIDTSGRKIIAVLLSADENSVTLRKDGKEYTLALSRLCEADRAYVRQTPGVKTGSKIAVGVDRVVAPRSGKHWRSVSQWKDGTLALEGGQRFQIWPEPDDSFIARKEDSGQLGGNEAKVDVKLHWILNPGQNPPGAIDRDEGFSLLFLTTASRMASEGGGVTRRNSVPVEFPGGAKAGIMKAQATLGDVTGEGNLIVVLKRERQGKDGKLNVDAIREVQGELAPETLSNVIILNVSVSE